MKKRRARPDGKVLVQTELPAELARSIDLMAEAQRRSRASLLRLILEAWARELDTTGGCNDPRPTRTVPESP